MMTSPEHKKSKPKIPANRRWMLAFALIFSMLFLSQCAGGLENFVQVLGGIFHGNTQKEFTEYNLEEKRAYHHYKLYKRALTKEKQKEEVRRLKTSATPQPSRSL